VSETARRRWEPPLNSSSWGGALIIMSGVAAVIWVVQVVDAHRRYSLNRFGLRPRRMDGLWGIVTQPFLHHDYSQTLADTAPLIGIGWVLLLSGVRVWATVSAIVLVVGGAISWAAAPTPHSGVIVGDSVLVFGWLGYLLARAYFSRKVRWILSAVAVLFFFGTLLGSLLPSYGSTVPWQAHWYGFSAGVAAGAVLHPRRASRRPAVSRRTAVS
jgi:membrane associated rhomboid family serine protease